MKFLTVILLTYNHEKTIAKAFDSILEQETDFDFDVFVLEDCSTDQTSEICREYQVRFPDKIHLFLNEKNLGVTQNYRQGLLKVTAKYFAVLEGDDYWCDKTKLQKQVTALELNPDCMIAGHDTLYRDLGNNKEWSFVSKFDAELKTRYSAYDNFRVHPSSRVYRNSIDLTNVPSFMMFDKRQYLLYLSKGQLLYINEIMSVYNDTGSGFWSGGAILSKRLLELRLDYETNKYFDFVYDKKFRITSKFLKVLKQTLGVRLGWGAYCFLESFRLNLKFLFRRKSNIHQIPK